MSVHQKISDSLNGQFVRAQSGPHFLEDLNFSKDSHLLWDSITFFFFFALPNTMVIIELKLGPIQVIQVDASFEWFRSSKMGTKCTCMT